MTMRHCFAMTLFSLLVTSSANGQVVSGIMTVTGAEMHWWAGVARDATARLYDVDEDTVEFKKLQQTEKYDQGTVSFRARKGKLIDLDKLHESIWATRLSGGTNSGVVSLEVTAIGQVVVTLDEIALKVSGSDSEFVLLQAPDEAHAAALDNLQAATDRSTTFRVTGQIADYAGRWPDVLKEQPAKPRRILVTSFEVME